MSQTKEDLERDLALAFKHLAEVAGRSGQSAENQYGQAYQRLVRAGFRPQLRRRYRTHKG